MPDSPADAVRERAPRVWTLWTASRPAQLLLVVAVYALGVAIAAARGASPAESSVAAGLLSLLFVAAAIHYANEYADHDTDALTERTPFSGGSGALQATGLPRELVGRAAAVALTVGLAAAALFVSVGLLSTTAGGLLAVSALVGIEYSLPPLSFARRGLGELVNALLGGLALPCYGAAVVGGLDRAVALAVLPFALLVFVNLLETQWPDRHADADVGKDTLAVRWPPRRLRAAYALVTVAAFAVLLALTRDIAAATPDVVPWAVTLSTLPAMPLFAWGAVRYTRRETPYPAVVGMVVAAVLQLLAWTFVAVG
ncbi:prenyltransferase [Natronomonas marina]|uniref:prenyltransferase n=1 Tax=Natronomonas marina TaxID=2961939 RepID=UPI0020C9E37C|nr:prenyltransferase [Natronomonas marina]